MSAQVLFERAWADVTAGATPDDAARRHALPAREREDLAAAAVLRRMALAGPALDLDAEWEALERLLASTPGRTAVRAPVRASNVTRIERAAPRRRLGRALARSLLAVAAAAAVLGSLSLRSMPGSPLYQLRRGLERTALVLSPNDGRLHAGLAAARLGDLVHALTDGPADDAPALAQDLVRERSAAVDAGVDVSALDGAVAAEVPPALSRVPSTIALEVRTILGGLLPPEGGAVTGFGAGPSGGRDVGPGPGGGGSSTSAADSGTGDQSSGDSTGTDTRGDTGSSTTGGTDPKESPSPSDSPDPDSPSPTESPSPSDSPDPTDSPSPSDSPDPTDGPTPES